MAHSKPRQLVAVLFENQDDTLVLKLTNNTSVAFAPGLRILLGPVKYGRCFYPTLPGQLKFTGFEKRSEPSRCGRRIGPHVHVESDDHEHNGEQLYDAVFATLFTLKPGQMVLIPLDSDLLEGSVIDVTIERTSDSKGSRWVPLPVAPKRKCCASTGTCGVYPVIRLTA